MTQNGELKMIKEHLSMVMNSLPLSLSLYLLWLFRCVDKCRLKHKSILTEPKHHYFGDAQCSLIEVLFCVVVDEWLTAYSWSVH